jgi:ribulose-5-phosphate 4-epimerase/fuculose-1-phosphate aldolase
MVRVSTTQASVGIIALLTDSNDQRVEDLITAYAILLHEQVLDSFGHISFRSANELAHFFMPRAMPPSLVTANDVLEYRIEDSQPIDQRGRRVNGERFLHGEIYKARPDVHAVIHSHSQACIPFSLTAVPLRPVIVQAGFLPLTVPNFEVRDVRSAGDRGMQITDAARGAALARTLGPAPVALLRGHGNVVVGSSLKQATVFAVYTDINARMQAAAFQIDRNIALMDEPELFGPSEFDINRPWQNYRQKLLDDEARAQVDRGQFGLEQTQPAKLSS